MIDLFIYCAGLICLVVMFSFIVEMVENRWNNSWRERITADDIEQLRRLFETGGATVAYNEKGEKFLVGYKKD